MSYAGLFTSLANGTNTVLDVVDTAIDVVGVPLTGIWAGLNTTLAVGAGAALGPIAPATAVAIGGAAAVCSMAATYYGSHTLTNLFRSSAAKKDVEQPYQYAPAYGAPALA